MNGVTIVNEVDVLSDILEDIGLECNENADIRELEPQYSVGDTEEVVGLRLDWELSPSMIAEGLSDNFMSKTAQFMFSQIENDMNDLLVNGDTSSSDDLLKTLDGSKKTGRSVESAKINIKKVFKSYHEGAKVHQYHVYFDLIVKWSND